MQTREIGLGDQAFYEQTVDDKTSKSKSQILIKKKVHDPCYTPEREMQNENIYLAAEIPIKTISVLWLLSCGKLRHPVNLCL